jgi:hypothetical protein
MIKIGLSKEMNEVLIFWFLKLVLSLPKYQGKRTNSNPFKIVAKERKRHS